MKIDGWCPAGCGQTLVAVVGADHDRALILCVRRGCPEPDAVNRLLADPTTGWRPCELAALNNGDRVRLVTIEEFVYSVGDLSAVSHTPVDLRNPLRLVHGIPSAPEPLPTFTRTLERRIEDPAEAGTP